ncbi:hypothetical protein [Herbaspirillum lusitanum]|uniref:hypothetical protein n=1 Tax=Herbaspirillum lusitanum TaxID=213312 RepID=UPI0022385417|nr:hypothetical protein [Herbaspirillum lusitanum]
MGIKDDAEDRVKLISKNHRKKARFLLSAHYPRITRALPPAAVMKNAGAEICTGVFHLQGQDDPMDSRIN